MTKKKEIKNQISKLKRSLEVIEKQLEELDTPITERIETFDDAIEYLGLDNILVKQYSCCWYIDGPGSAYFKLQIITAALNEEPEGWKPKNYPEDKRWGVSYSVDKCGSTFNLGFAVIGNEMAGSYSEYGARLCYKTRELAEYSARQFKDIWEEFLIAK